MNNMTDKAGKADKRKNSRQADLPPGQTSINRLLKWGEDHPGITRNIPRKDLENWTLTVDGEVENPLRLSWREFQQLPKVESVSDFHCVEGWSVLGCKWTGVQFSYIASLAKPKPSAGYVMFECADGYSTSLLYSELAGGNVLLAYMLDGKELEAGYGGPLRLVVPDKYAYKSAMWVTRIRFMSERKLGFWESRGYSDTADVWKNDRFTR